MSAGWAGGSSSCNPARCRGVRRAAAMGRLVPLECPGPFASILYGAGGPRVQEGLMLQIGVPGWPPGEIPSPMMRAQAAALLEIRTVSAASIHQAASRAMRLRALLGGVNGQVDTVSGIAAPVDRKGCTMVVIKWLEGGFSAGNWCVVFALGLWFARGRRSERRGLRGRTADEGGGCGGVAVCYGVQFGLVRWAAARGAFGDNQFLAS